MHVPLPPRAACADLALYNALTSNTQAAAAAVKPIKRIQIPEVDSDSSEQPRASKRQRKVRSTGSKSCQAQVRDGVCCLYGMKGLLQCLWDGICLGSMSSQLLPAASA